MRGSVAIPSWVTQKVVMFVRGHRCLVLMVALGTSACSPPPPFAVESIEPATGSQLRINEPIVLRFNRDLDPSSIDDTSVAVTSEEGIRVTGSVEARGRTVTYRPKPIEAVTLDDGGYPPGKAVALRLTGFPSLRGIRSSRGEILPSAESYPFGVLAREVTSSIAELFVDVDPGHAPHVITLGMGVGDACPRLQRDQWYCVEFSEPLWPPSITESAIRVLFDNPDRTETPSDLRLKQDFDRAEVWVRPRDGFQAGTRYIIDVVGEQVLDLSGVPMAGAWRTLVEGVPPSDELGATDARSEGW